MAVFDDVLDANTQTRGQLLDAQPTAIRRDVAVLLGAEAQTSRFLEQPAIETAGLLPTATRDGCCDASRVEGVLVEGVPQVPGYRLLRKLDQGGMGTVWVAQPVDVDGAKPVAVKVAARSLPPSQRERVAREGAILARLRHPHIATLIETGTCDDGRPFLAMELIDGQTIDHYCSHHQLDLRAIVGLTQQICAALEHAHAQGIVHCDLKPGNVLVDAKGAVKLLDFGIAKVLHPEDVPFAVDPTVGARPLTLRYASPEQLAGGVITPQSDVYSLWVLLTKLATGRVTEPRGTGATEPWRALSPPPTDRTPQRLLSGQGRDGGRLEIIRRQALQPRPERRYASMALVKRDLDRLLAGGFTLPRMPELLDRVRGALNRRPFASVATALALGFFLATMLGNLLT